MRPRLRATGLASTIQTWRDVLHEGPVPNVPEDALRRIRSKFLQQRGAADIGTETEFEARDQALIDHREGEFVLWFEADLYDQLQVVEILTRLRRLDVPAERITLIRIGEFPGIAHFGGLAELSAEQLASLPQVAATTLSSAALRHAAHAWTALCAPDPSALGTIAATPSAELRFVAEAFDRLSREYPSTRDGLSLTERRILAAIAEVPTTAGAVFIRTGAREARPFLGDTWCFDRMTSLLNARTPLIASVERLTTVSSNTPLRLTDAGRLVLNGGEDHVTLNGIDRWIGGVHLKGRAVLWRWDEGTESVVSADAWTALPADITAHRASRQERDDS